MMAGRMCRRNLPRCLRCNGRVCPVHHESITDRVEAGCVQLVGMHSHAAESRALIPGKSRRTGGIDKVDSVSTGGRKIYKCSIKMARIMTGQRISHHHHRTRTAPLKIVKGIDSTTVGHMRRYLFASVSEKDSLGEVLKFKAA